MYTKKDFSEGQELFYKQQRSKEIRKVEIIKVGNKLLHTACGYKIYIDTLRNKTEYAAIQFYISKKETEEEIQARKNWSKIQGIITGRNYRSLTHQQIHDLHVAVKKILGE